MHQQSTTLAIVQEEAFPAEQYAFHVRLDRMALSLRNLVCHVRQGSSAPMTMPLAVSRADQVPLAAAANPLAQSAARGDLATAVRRCVTNVPLEPSPPALASPLASNAKRERFPRKEQPSAWHAMLERAPQKDQQVASIAHLVALLHPRALCVWFVLKARTTPLREQLLVPTVLVELFLLPS